ncbi:unnamed protein product [Bathycoccus prasinos]
MNAAFDMVGISAIIGENKRKQNMPTFTHSIIPASNNAASPLLLFLAVFAPPSIASRVLSKFARILETNTLATCLCANFFNNPFIFAFPRATIYIDPSESISIALDPSYTSNTLEFFASIILKAIEPVDRSEETKVFMIDLPKALCDFVSQT